MSDFEHSELERDDSEAIEASHKFTEWMGLLMADHAHSVQKRPDGSQILEMDNSQMSAIVHDLPQTSAVITSRSKISRPELTLTVQADSKSKWLTRVSRVAPEEYYTIVTTKRVTTEYGSTEDERVDLPHPVTQKEVNNILNEIAKLRPPKSEADVSRNKKSAFGRWIGKLLGRGE